MKDLRNALQVAQAQLEKEISAGLEMKSKQEIEIKNLEQKLELSFEDNERYVDPTASCIC